MERFADHVHRLENRGRVVLWNACTGRHLALSSEGFDAVTRWPRSQPPPPDLAILARRMHDLGLLAESPQMDLSVLYPARSRRVLLFVDEPLLWAPRPMQRTPGGFAHAAYPLTPSQVAIWRACNGSRTTAQVATHAGVSLAETLAFFARLTPPDVQALQLRRRPTQRRDPALLHLVAPRRPAHLRADHHYGAHGETTLQHWHANDITDGSRHFDDRETTVAHAFAIPHPALDGEPYGARLYGALEQRGLLMEEGLTVEIGPGDGELGEAWLACVGKRGRPHGEYLRLDISPELLRTQRQRQPGTREMLGSATQIPLPDASVHLIVCNEVIADLSSAPYDAETGDGSPAVAEALQRWGVHPLPGNALYNLGAWMAIAEAARVLAPGGVAVFTEFGAEDETPTETRHLDHPEVSIRFSHLRQVAEACGLSATVMPLDELLCANLSTRWLSRHSHEALRARAQAEGWHLPARAWTEESLSLPWRVEGLEWTPITDHGPGPLMTRFAAIVLRR